MKTDFTELTDMTAAQRAKLPAYVRGYLTLLERTLHETENRLYSETSRLGQRNYKNGSLTDPRHEPEQGIIVDPSGKAPLAIAGNFTVRFWLPMAGHHRWIDARIGTGNPRRTDEVCLELCGANGLELMPAASNVVFVKVHP